MDTNEIIAQIDTEIARLQEVRGILAGTTTSKTGRERSPKKSASPPTQVAAKKRAMSAEGRLRIAAAQRARWAKSRKAA